MKNLVLFCLGIGIIGCGGIHGELANNTGVNRSVDLSGAVFAWVDQSDADLVSWESPRLALAFTGLSVDPADDLLALSGSKLADLQLRFATGDVMAIIVPDASRQSGSTTLEAELVPGAFRCPPLNQALINSQALACFSAAPETLDSAAEFDGFAPIGRKAKLTLELDEGGRKTGETISGSITLSVERLDSDSEQAVTGNVTGTFSVELLGERLAERNLLMLTGAQP
tara:strand:+ start:138 stop:818 length:681 start_codon:yes stop_codon:yes gene_type:complete